jgi:membrane-bound metal-dependent hydrolase YbcI (DUF457 family)
MSSKPTHFKAGWLLGVVLASSTYFWKDNIAFSACVALGAGLGSSLPDQLEIAWHEGGGRKSGWFSFYYEEGIRHSLIPHRTITHWFVLWCVLLAWMTLRLMGDPNMLDFLAFGLVSSAWLHIYMDSRTPMGIPILHPWKRSVPKRKPRK